MSQDRELSSPSETRRATAQRMSVLDIRHYAVHDSYVDVMGVVVAIYEKKYFIIDDGSAQILVRSVNGEWKSETINSGDVAHVIGKVYEGAEGKNIFGQIIKKIKNPDWIKVRRAELNLMDKGKEVLVNAEGRRGEMEAEEEERGDSAKYILNLIKKLDRGQGVLVDDLLKSAPMGECKSIIEMLMNRGDIFEIEPGKIKLLE